MTETIRSADGHAVRVERRRLGRRSVEAAPAATVSLAEALKTLAGRVRRLTVSRSDPERFHVERSAIAGEIDRLAEGEARARSNRGGSK